MCVLKSALQYDNSGVRRYPVNSRVVSLTSHHRSLEFALQQIVIATLQSRVTRSSTTYHITILAFDLNARPDGLRRYSSEFQVGGDSLVDRN